MNYIIDKIDTYSNNLDIFDEEQTRSILRGKNNIIINSKQELIYYVLEAFCDKNSNKNIHLGIIPNKVILRIKNKITDITKENLRVLFKDGVKYALVINQEEIRHMKKESLREIDVLNFILNLDNIITHFDNVRYSIYNNKQNALRFKKKINDMTNITLTVISNKYHTFRVQTLFFSKDDFKIKRNLSPTLNEL